MLRPLFVGILLGIALVIGGVYWYFESGRAPVAVADGPMPFEHALVWRALKAHEKKLPHVSPQVAADETTFLAAAEIYRKNCAVCHGLPGEVKTLIAEGMSPDPPQLFHGTGVTDDEPWQTYWTAKGGVRMTGMPSFDGKLSEIQLWQVTMLLKNADKISSTVKAALLSHDVPSVPTPGTVVSPLPPPTR